MKAYTLKSAGIIEKIERDEPVIGPADVLIDVHYVGLCGSDLNSFRGQMPLVTYPRIPGHEISGVIQSKGINVPGHINIGDNVTVSPYTHCGLCPACRQGRTNACEFNQTLGVQRDGGLQEKIAIPYEKVFKSNLLSLQELALVEPLSVGYHATNMGKVTENDSVLIIGCGTIGMGALYAAVWKGAQVIALDIDDEKLDTAKKYGATHGINSTKVNAKETINTLTNNEGVSVVIEAVGHAETIRMAIDLVAFTGRVVYIGYAKSDVEIDTRQIVRKELNISGSRNALDVFPAVISMLEKRDKPYPEMITRVFPFNETEAAFIFWNDNPAKVSKILIDVQS